jgi:hypothetical protein
MNGEKGRKFRFHSHRESRFKNPKISAIALAKSKFEEVKVIRSRRLKKSKIEEIKYFKESKIGEIKDFKKLKFEEFKV